MPNAGAAQVAVPIEQERRQMRARVANVRTVSTTSYRPPGVPVNNPQALESREVHRFARDAREAVANGHCSDRGVGARRSAARTCQPRPLTTWRRSRYGKLMVRRAQRVRAQVSGVKHQPSELRAQAQSAAARPPWSRKPESSASVHSGSPAARAWLRSASVKASQSSAVADRRRSSSDPATRPPHGRAA